MNIRINNGQRTITLTKGERAALVKARDLSGELSKQGQGDAAGSAQRAWLALDQVIDYFTPDDADASDRLLESEPEAAAEK